MNRRDKKYLFLIILIFVAACIETDIYLPAFPDMMEYFHTNAEVIQSLLTWNFFGICVSGPFYGPLSDSFGRKKPLMVALSLFFIGSVLTIFAESFNILLWGRLLQGIGSGGCFTLGTAIIFDAFQEKKAIKAVNQLNLIVPFLMALAPMAGGYLNYAYGFRSNFLTIAVFVAASLILCLLLFDESLPKEKQVPFNGKQVLRDFKKAFVSVPFWQLTILVSIIFAAYMAFLAGTAVLFVVDFGLSKKVFPFFQAAILGAWLLASLTCSRAIDRWTIQAVKKSGVVMALVGAVTLLVSCWLTPKDPYWLTLGMLFYAFGVNWIQSLYFPDVMVLIPEIKGTVASLLTSVRLLVTAALVGLTSSFYNGTVYPIIIVVVGAIAVAFVIILFYEKKQLSSKTSE